MNKTWLKSLGTRIPKFIGGNLLGTLVDTLVLWVFSHFVFNNFFGEVIVSPIISFEAAAFVNFVVSYYLIWKDRITDRSARTFMKRFGVYNASCVGGFVIKMGALLLIQGITKWDVVICNLLALCVSGGFNFFMNELVIFRKKKE